MDVVRVALGLPLFGKDSHEHLLDLIRSVASFHGNLLDKKERRHLKISNQVYVLKPRLVPLVQTFRIRCYTIMCGPKHA